MKINIRHKALLSNGRGRNRIKMNVKVKASIGTPRNKYKSECKSRRSGKCNSGSFPAWVS